MVIFLDTGKIEEIKKYHSMGIIRGVTTNPTILSKQGFQDLNSIKTCTLEIAACIDPLPISIEVTTNQASQMLEQAQEMASWARNINVKIPIHGPKGETENLQVIHELETKHHIPVNVTAMMSAQQGLLAALSGATYVSLFCGRINNMGYNSTEEIKKLRKLIDDFHLKSKIIAASTREILNIVEWLEAGAHIVTVLPSILEGMMVHPYTKETVQMFLRDAEKSYF